MGERKRNQLILLSVTFVSDHVIVNAVSLTNDVDSNAFELSTLKNIMCVGVGQLMMRNGRENVGEGTEH